MGLLSLFSRAEPADGAAPALEAIATGVNLGAAAIDVAPPARRYRQAEAGVDAVTEAMGTKLLHGWLQNRHQTLMPLSLNLSIMSREQQEGLAQILAALLLAGRPAAEAAEAAPALRGWLGGLGAGTDVLACFDDALAAPLPLNAVFDTALANELTVYAFVAALMASDPRFAVSVMLCDLIQTRFDLPSAVVRSAVRRYRR